MSNFDLNGIDEISDYSRQRHETLLRWRNFFELPIVKVGGIWRGNRAEITKWARERGVSSVEEMTEARVMNHFERRRLEAEAEAGEDTVSGSLGAISKALGDIPLAILQGWLREWSDCPLKVFRKGHYEVSKAAFRLWLSRHPGLVKRKGVEKSDIEYAF